MRIARFALFLALVVPRVPAQEADVLVLEGDLIPGIGAVTAVLAVAVERTGVWVAHVRTDHPDPGRDEALLRAGEVVLREGDLLAAPAGASIAGLGALSLGPGGALAVDLDLAGTAGTGDDAALYLDGELLIQEGQAVDSPALSPGSPWSAFFDVELSAGGHLLVIGAAEDVAIPGSLDRVLARLELAGGTLAATDILWKEGDFLPGEPHPITIFGAGPHHSAIDGAGRVLFFADTSGPGDNDGVVFLAEQLVAKEGEPSPAPGRDWTFALVPSMDLNEVGQWALFGELAGEAASDELIALDGAAFVQKGDSLPAIAPFRLTALGTPSGAIALSDFGEPLWHGRFDDPDASRDAALFLGHEILARKGVARAAGQPIAELEGGARAFDLSADGRLAVFRATLADGREGAFLLRPSLGRPYGDAAPNSTGAVARLAAKGSAQVGAGELVFLCDALPPGPQGPPLSGEASVGETGMLVHGPRKSSLPFGDGTLLVGGALRRGPVAGSSDGLWRASLAWQAHPHLVPGTTWHFQLLYRDSATPAGRNGSTAIALEIE